MPAANSIINLKLLQLNVTWLFHKTNCHFCFTGDKSKGFLSKLKATLSESCNNYEGEPLQQQKKTPKINTSK